MQILNHFISYLKITTRMSNDQYECLIILDITAEKLIGELSIVRLLIKTKINDLRVFERERKFVDNILQRKEISVSQKYFISNKKIFIFFKIIIEF